MFDIDMLSEKVFVACPYWDAIQAKTRRSGPMSYLKIYNLEILDVVWRPCVIVCEFDIITHLHLAIKDNHSKSCNV